MVIKQITVFEVLREIKDINIIKRNITRLQAGESSFFYIKNISMTFISIHTMIEVEGRYSSMKKLSIIYVEANGECLVMEKIKDAVPVVPNVGERVGLGSAFYEVDRRDFVYIEESNDLEVYIYLNEY